MDWLQDFLTKSEVKLKAFVFCAAMVAIILTTIDCALTVVAFTYWPTFFTETNIWAASAMEQTTPLKALLPMWARNVMILMLLWMSVLPAIVRLFFLTVFGGAFMIAVVNNTALLTPFFLGTYP